jgi:hypothetical protein
MVGIDAKAGTGAPSDFYQPTHFDRRSALIQGAKTGANNAFLKLTQHLSRTGSWF